MTRANHTRDLGQLLTIMKEKDGRQHVNGEPDKSVKEYWMLLLDLLLSDSLTRSHLKLSDIWDVYVTHTKTTIITTMEHMIPTVADFVSPLERLLFHYGIARTKTFSQSRLGELNDMVDELKRLIRMRDEVKYDVRYQKLLILVLNSRGVTFENLYMMEDAIEDYSLALKLDCTYAMAHYNLANVYLSLERKSEAIESYTRAIEYDPDYECAYLNRSLIYDSRFQTVLAFRDADIACHIRSSNSNTIQRQMLALRLHQTSKCLIFD